MTVVIFALSFLWLNTTIAKIHALQSCQQLQAPNAVLLVHASWCPHCKDYLPVYNAVSNLPEMQNYKFYVKRDDRGAPVCGVQIRGFPTTFTNNMRNSTSGEMTENGLIRFVSNS